MERSATWLVGTRSPLSFEGLVFLHNVWNQLAKTATELSSDFNFLIQQE